MPVTIVTPAAHPTERALLIGVDIPHPEQAWTTDESLAELGRLADTAGAVVVGKLVQRLRAPHPTTYLGKGKLEELAERVRQLDCRLVIADDELSMQQRAALEVAAGVPVVDRTLLILDIFAQHAQTREGRLQVELAQLSYRLPRLTGSGEGMSRLGGGIGTRGPGETKLENDRRRIRRRIAELSREIADVSRQRLLQRRWRTRQGVPVIAVVGYTNAGKSTLFNALTRATVHAADQLFATLDPTTRQLILPNGQKAVLIDTVGFIHKLPVDLVAAFRATLQEIRDADVLMHVVDTIHPQVLAQCLTVYEEVSALGAGDKLMVTALNKIDLLPEPLAAGELDRFPNAVAVSALTGEGTTELLTRLSDVLAVEMQPITVRLPYDIANDLVRLFRQRGAVEDERYSTSGLMVRGKLPPELLSTFQQYAV